MTLLEKYLKSVYVHVSSKRLNLMIMPVHLVCALLILMLAVSGNAWAAGQGDTSYVLGVFPHLPPRELEKVYAPISRELSDAVGRTVKFRSSSTYSNFMDKLGTEDFDIVFTQPFDYVTAADRHGYLPLATRGEPLATVVVVKSGSPLKTLEDLRGKKISLPPKVAAVSYLLRAHLVKNGIIPGEDVKLSYHRSHVSCLQQVIIGAADACGTAAPALRFFSHKMSVELDVISKTTEIPHTLFAVHPRVPEKDRELLQKKILSWSESEKGRKMLKAGRLKPFIKIEDKDYDIVREMSKNVK